MLEIKNNKINVTRGDSLPLEISIFDKITKEPYETQEGDTCRFAISIGYKGDEDYELILEKPVSMAERTLMLSPEDTTLPYDTYNYDVEITHLDGTVETFISSKITITGECD